jgi:hypothetical protein
MERRRLRSLLVLAVAICATAALLPGRAQASRLHVRVVGDAVIVRVVGSKAHSIRYTLGHHKLGRRRRAPFNFVLYGYAPARSEAAGPRVRLVARNAKNGRVLGIARLRRTWKPIRQSKAPNPHVSFTSTPPATTTATTATISFTTKDATAATCSFDGAPFVSCASPVTFSALALGKHALTVVASNSAAFATVATGWTVLAPPPPPPPPPPSSGSKTTVPVSPPSAYSTPATAVTVYSSAQLNQALSASKQDIVVADGVYDNSGPFVNANGDRVYAQHLGGAIFKAGFVLGGNWGPGHGVLQGLAFDVSNSSKVLNGSIVHIWGTGSNSQVLDTTLEGNSVISSGILAREVEGVVIRRVVARDFRDWGVIVDPNTASYTPATPPVLEDVDSANVSWPTARASNGTAEACVWVGVKAVVRRLKARNCAWEGLWVGTGTRDSVFEDLDLNETDIGVYVEHFASHTTFRRIHAGPNVVRGLTCEWADPAWDSRAACSDDVIENSYFDTKVVGVYLDQGTTRTTVRNTTFVNQRCGAIGNYAGVGNLWDTSGNDYGSIASSAVAVYTHHLYSCPS